MNHVTFNLSLIEISEVTEAKFSRQEESFVTKAAVRVTLRVYGGVLKNILHFIYLLPEMSETQRAQNKYNNL